MRGQGMMRFMQLNPARGRKLAIRTIIHTDSRFMVYAAQPSEGTETTPLSLPLQPKKGLCSSTPRGDGNLCKICVGLLDELKMFMQLNPARGRKHRPFSIHLGWFKVEVYAAQPREGTETRTWTSLPSSSVNVWFMQLGPARGRKLE